MILIEVGKQRAEGRDQKSEGEMKKHPPSLGYGEAGGWRMRPKLVART